MHSNEYEPTLLQSHIAYLAEKDLDAYRKCPECGWRDIIHAERDGDFVCRMCGLCIASAISDKEPPAHWRVRDVAESTGDCSMDIDHKGPDYTYVSSGLRYSEVKGSTYKAVFHWHERIAQLNCEDPDLPRDLLDEAGRIYSRILEYLEEDTKIWRPRSQLPPGHPEYLSPAEEAQWKLLPLDRVAQLLDQVKGTVRDKYKKVKRRRYHPMRGSDCPYIYESKRQRDFWPCNHVSSNKRKHCRCKSVRKVYLERWVRIRYELTGQRPRPMPYDLIQELEIRFLRVVRSWNYVRHHPDCPGNWGIPCHKKKKYKCRHNLPNYGFMFLQFFQDILAKDKEGKFEYVKEYFPYIKTLETPTRMNHLKQKWRELEQYTGLPLYPISIQEDSDESKHSAYGSHGDNLSKDCRRSQTSSARSHPTRGGSRNTGGKTVRTFGLH